MAHADALSDRDAATVPEGWTPHEFCKNVNGSSSANFAIDSKKFLAGYEKANPAAADLLHEQGACSRINCPGSFEALGHLRATDPQVRAQGEWKIAPLCTACNNTGNVKPMLLKSDKIVSLNEVRKAMGKRYK